MATSVISREIEVSVSLETINVTCNGASNGSVIATITGGVPPYTYLWSNSSTTKDLIGVPAGLYTLVVSDSNGDSAEGQTMVREPLLPLTQTVTVTQPTANNPSGSIFVSPRGGNGGYEYQLNSFSGTVDWIFLEFKIFNLQRFSKNFFIPSNFQIPTTPQQLANIASSDLVLEINSNFFDIDGTFVPVLGQQTQLPQNRIDKIFDPTPPPGTSNLFTLYSPTVNDIPIWFDILPENVVRLHINVPYYKNLGIDVCKSFKFCSVTQTSTNVWNIAQSSEVVVTNQPSNQCWVTNRFFENVSSGTWYVITRDKLNCQTIPEEIVILPPPPNVEITISKSDIVCFGDTTGQIYAIASGGNPPYSYSIDGFNYYNSGEFNNLSAGSYTVYVRDSVGVIRTRIVEILQNDPLDIIGQISYLDQENALSSPVLCPEVNPYSGVISVSATGGVPPYTYQMDVPIFIGGYGYAYGGVNLGDVVNVGYWEGLVAGVYEITVSDSVGCQKTFEIEVGSLQPLTISYSIETIEIVVTPGVANIKKRVRISNVFGGQPILLNPQDVSSVDPARPYIIRIYDESINLIFDNSDNIVYESAPVYNIKKPYPILIGNLNATSPFLRKFRVYYEYPFDVNTNSQVGGDTIFIEVEDYFGCVKNIRVDI